MSEQKTFTTLKSKLEQISEQKIDKQDYQSQIIRWNNYVDTLADIRRITERLFGVRLQIKRHSNWKPWSQRTWLKNGRLDMWEDRNISMSVISGAFGIIGLVIGLLLNNLYLGLSIASPMLFWLSLIGYDFYTHSQKPEILHMKLGAELHIDEFAYARNMIKDLPPIQRDPTIILPSVELVIPRQWLATESTKHLMNQMENIKL